MSENWWFCINLDSDSQTKVRMATQTAAMRMGNHLCATSAWTFIPATSLSLHPMTSGLGEVQRTTEHYWPGSPFPLLALDRGSANKVGGGEGGSGSLP
jgi:hypothetical protein